MTRDLPPLRLGEERVSPDEARIAEETTALVKRGLIEIPPGDLVKRDAHPKAHGCVRADFVISADVPNRFRHGIFARTTTYPAWIRFSNSAKGPDTKPDVRGMAIKVCQVFGEKILDDEKATQDFIFISDPVMPVGEPGEYLAFFKTVVGKNPWHALVGVKPSHLLRAASVLRRILALKAESPLSIRYWSTTPYKLGEGAVKYSVKPGASATTASPSTRGPHYLRQALVAALDKDDASFDFMVQVQTDPVSMPVEDCATEWKESESPFIKVATITIPAQQFSSPEQEAFGENLSFNPWHSLAAHRPLGGINRIRRVIYEAITSYRHERNNAPRLEPTGDERL
ncbi:MAG: catalase family protein [Vicinamibacteria bacterium]